MREKEKEIERKKVKEREREKQRKRKTERKREREIRDRPGEDQIWPEYLGLVSVREIWYSICNPALKVETVTGQKRH